MSFIEKFRHSLTDVLKGILAHPAMLVILCHAWIAVCFVETDAISDYSGIGYPVLAPVFAFVSIFIDRLCKGRGKWSLAVLPLYFGSCYLKVLDGFEETVAFIVICFAILPLCYLWIARKKDDISFIRQAYSSGHSALLALIFTGILVGVTLLILLSMDYLFKLEIDNALTFWFPYFFIFVLMFPLFVSFDERGERTSPVKTIERILNLVVSPALIIYTLILLVYLVRIICKQTLPEGGLAAMVLAFSIVLFICRSFRRIQDKKPFEWFYRYSWIISIPIFVLFWVGLFRRLSDYGFTTSRYYLAISGVIMMILNFRKDGRDSSSFYHYFSLVLSVLLVVSISCPGVNHKDVSLLSQRNIVSRQAAALGILDEDGKFVDGPYACNDSSDMVAHRKIYQALKAMGETNNSSCSRYFGIDSFWTYYGRLPENARRYVDDYRPGEIKDTDSDFIVLYYPSKTVEGVYGFKYLLAHPVGSTTKLQEMGVEFDRWNFIEAQALKCGWDGLTELTASWLQEHEKEILTIETEDFRIIISSLQINRNDDGKWIVSKERGNFLLLEYILFNDCDLIERIERIF